MTCSTIHMCRFKMKVGVNRDEDERRVEIVRQQIGADCDLV